MDQIDLALLIPRFLPRVQFLRESAQLFRSAPHLLHDTSCLSCASSWTLPAQLVAGLTSDEKEALPIARRRRR
jgi:hypothetical protein